MARTYALIGDPVEMEGTYNHARSAGGQVYVSI